MVWTDEEIQDLRAQAAQQVQPVLDGGYSAPEPLVSSTEELPPAGPPPPPAPPPPEPPPELSGPAARRAWFKENILKPLEEHYLPNTEDRADPALQAKRTAAAGNTEDQDNPQLAASRQAQAAQQTAPQGGPPPAGGPAPPPGFQGPPPVVIPGGWRGETRDTKIVEGKPVDPAIRAGYDAAAGLDTHAAAQMGGADRSLFERDRDLFLRRAEAADQARIQHQRIQDERNFVVQNRLADIERLNAEAQGKPEDLWSTPKALAAIIGAIAVGVGMATGKPMAMVGAGLFAGTVNSIINQDIQAKREARKNAGERAGREINLLNLHRERLNDEDKAIEATKLAYYDNVLQQMDAYKAQHAAQVSEPVFMQRVAEIMREREKTKLALDNQEQGTVTRELHEKNRQAQILGGIGASAGPGNVLRMPDGKGGYVSYAMPNENIYNKTVERIGAYQSLIRMNNDIAQLRRELSTMDPTHLPTEAHTEYEAKLKKLDELEQTKLKAVESASHQGVLREGEYPRAQAMTGFATAGLGRWERHSPWNDATRIASDRALTDQTARWERDLLESPRDHQGKIVFEGYIQNPLTGELSPTAKYTGQDPGPRAGLPPPGSRSADPRQPVRTMPALSDQDTTPPAPRFAPPPPGVSSGDSGKRSHKKK